MDGESDKLQIINDFLIKHNDLFKKDAKINDIYTSTDTEISEIRKLLKIN